jgi:hypothetical protein
MQQLSHTTEPALPSSYVVEQRQQCCNHCGRSHSFTALYIKTKYAGSGNPHRLTPVLRPSDIVWNVPIEHRQLPIERIPFCHECRATVHLGYLRSPPQPVAPQPVIVNTTFAVADKPAAKPKAKPVYTVDDLLAGQ